MSYRSWAESLMRPRVGPWARVRARAGRFWADFPWFELALSGAGLAILAAGVFVTAWAWACPLVGAMAAAILCSTLTLAVGAIIVRAWRNWWRG